MAKDAGVGLAPIQMAGKGRRSSPFLLQGENSADHIVEARAIGREGDGFRIDSTLWETTGAAYPAPLASRTWSRAYIAGFRIAVTSSGTRKRTRGGMRRPARGGGENGARKAIRQPTDASIFETSAYRSCVRAALRALGVRQLVLAIHDASFPSQPAADTGRGSPYAEGGERFLTFVRDLGFDGVQLGPQGETTVDNPSPYDATIFSRSTTSLALDKLVMEGLLARESLERLVADRPALPAHRIAHSYVHFAHARALDEAFRRHRRGRGNERRSQDIERFTRQHHAWLERDELFEALRTEYGHMGWRDWRGSGDARLDAVLWDPPPGAEAAARRRRAALMTRHRDTIQRYRFGQFLAHRQHRELKRLARRLGLRLWGDVQIGFSDRDVWSYQALFLRGYCMGAPPSRTNPEGQAWGYPVLDPAQYWRAGTRPGAPARPGPGLRLVAARARKLWDEFDGLRIDHPHGLVCPWIYRSSTGDALDAVREGARLFSSPNLPDHPELAGFAIARRDQVSTDRGIPRYADEWVRSLTTPQVARYATVFDVVVAAAGRRTGSDALACEALSTLPYPVARVLARHRLGRFRVTQKASLENPADSYRSENAQSPDWIMVGTHDTPPLWRMLEIWRLAGTLEARARYLAERLEPDAGSRGTFAQTLAAEPGCLAHAQFADLFTGPARNVLIFFSDLFGESDAYNAPGTISATNWTLRLASNYLEVHQARLHSNRALSLPRALALAFRARGSAFISRHRELHAGLVALAARLGAGPLSDPLKLPAQ
jgi:4-alpha-glucanotransferase